MHINKTTLDEFLTPDAILYYMIGWIFLENTVDIYISSRQVKVYWDSKVVPRELENVMSIEVFEKARIYGLYIEQFRVFKIVLVNMIIMTIVLYFGLLAFIWSQALFLADKLYLDSDDEVAVSCVFFVMMGFLDLFLEMPCKVYLTFVLEAEHGFNKQSGKLFVIDQICGFLILQLILMPIVMAIIFIVKHDGQYLFVWLWLFTFILSLVLIFLHPNFIAPLFDSYRPLDDGPLKDSIEDLADSLDFPLSKLYIVDGSKLSTHSNAYFYGICGSKRIILVDTLLLNRGKPESEIPEEERGKGCSNEQVVAVLAHELGHWKLNHVAKNIVVIQVNILILFAAFGSIYEYGPIYEAVGFEAGDKPIIIGLIVIITCVMAPYNAAFQLVLKMISRKFEYEADEFANKLGYAKPLAAALIKVHADNRMFPIYDWLYTAWTSSHPTLLNRIKRLKELDAGNKSR